MNTETCIPDQATDNVCVMQEEKPRLYVITVNYESEAHVRRLVESLEPVSFVEKLVVVDHSPSQKLGALRSRFPIQVLHQPNRGYGAGLNRGLQEVKDTDGLILLCNPDVTILNHEAIVDIWHYMCHNPSVGLVIPAFVDARMRPIFSCRKFHSIATFLLLSNAWIRKRAPKLYEANYYNYHGDKAPLEVDWGCGAAMFIRPLPMKGRPLFDERFFLYYEDVDLCARMWQENRSVVYFPRLVCQHLESRLSHKGVRYFVVHLISLFKFILKYKGLPRRATLRQNGSG